MGTRKTLENMQTAIDNAYDSIEEMGGDVPQARNLVNLSGTIDDLQNSVIAGVRGTNDAYQSTGKSYTKGESCIYNNVVYTAKDAISAPAGEFDPSKWDESSLASLRSSISDISIQQVVKVSGSENIAGLHNGIYRGNLLYDLVNNVAGEFTSISAIHNAVSTGDFSNIYIGDYILIKITTSYKSNETVKMVVAGIDTYLHKGDTELTSHHLVLIPEEAFETTASMNGSHTIEGGYAGSAMHTTVLPIYATALNSALGGYMLTFRDLLTKTVNTSAASGAYSAWSGASSDWAWYSINIRLLSEVQVYGTRVLSSSMFDVGAANVQLPYFLLRPDKLVAHQGYGSSSRCHWWLSAVSYSPSFCFVTANGFASYTYAGDSFGVRPLVLFG